MHGRTWIAALAPFVALAMCAKPTQIRVEVFTEVPCDRRAIVGIAAASTPEAVTREPFTSTSTACEPTTRRVGAMVLQPSGDSDESIAVQIVTRDDAEPAERCIDGSGAAGCIVSRRKIRFSQNETRALRVDLRLSCLDVRCDDPSTTCVKGQCASAEVPEGCEGDCDESRLAFTSSPAPSADASLPDGNTTPTTTDADMADTTSPGLTWGRFVTKLALPDCPAPEAGAPVVLTVNTTDDELDGDAGTLLTPESAGPKMSLREALYIAWNIRNGTRITFDPAVFPIDRESTITLDERDMPSLIGACIDARGSGPVVTWKPTVDESNGPLSVWTVGAGASQIGLHLASRTKQRLVGQGTIAGCRYDVGYIAIEATNGIVGPSNAFVRATFGITQPDVGSVAIVKNNWLGFDPLRRVSNAQVQAAMQLRGATDVTGNVIVGTIGLSLVEGTTNIRDNYFGVNTDGTPISGLGTAIQTFSSAIIGPGNRIQGALGSAVDITTVLAVTITQNSITGNGAAIVNVAGGAQVPGQPKVSSVTTSLVTGTCSQAGTVEVFTDPTNQGETYVASAPCNASTGFSWAVSGQPIGASGRNVTATLTAAGRTSLFSSPTAIP